MMKVFQTKRHLFSRALQSQNLINNPSYSHSTNNKNDNNPAQKQSSQKKQKEVPSQNEISQRQQVMREEIQQYNREISSSFDQQYSTSESRREVRVRYAPSPTGELHIGGLRTALYNYLFAKIHKGKFILRIEDTDKTREVPGAVDRLADMLSWSGLEWDEGPMSIYSLNNPGQDGPEGPYIQSQRLQHYQKYANALLENKDAYHCFCTADRLKQLRVEQGGEKHQATKYDRFCLNLSKSEVEERIEKGDPYVIRMHVPHGQTEFKDIIHGKVIFNHNVIDDQVLLKSDGYPTYHLANVVDDHMMKISHVIRGEEWLSSTPKHLMLYKMLQLDAPEYAHLPLLLNDKGQKLSKRFGDVSVQQYKDKGFLPEAMINGLALLGWNPPHREDPDVLSQNTSVFLKHEVMNMKDLVATFDLDKVGKSGVKFGQDKLEFLNSMHIRNKFEYFDQLEAKKATNSWRKMLLDNLPANLHPHIKRVNENKMKKIMDLMKIRIHFFHDMCNHTYFFTEPDYENIMSEKFAKKLRQPHDVKLKILRELKTKIGKIDEDEFSPDRVNKECSIYLYENQKSGYKNEDVFFLLRYSMTGNPVGAPVGDILEIIGKQSVMKRFDLVIEHILNQIKLEQDKKSASD